MFSSMSTIWPAVGVLIVVVIVLLAIYHQTMRRKPPVEGIPLPFFAWFLMDVIFRPAIPLVKIGLVLLGVSPSGHWGSDLRVILDSAGLYTVREEDVMASQVLLGALAFLIILLVTGGNFFLAAPFGIIGVLYTYALLRRLAEERKQTMFSELPYVLDLLSLGIEAGLDFKASIDRLCAFSEASPLINELRLLLNDLNVGTPMEEALLRMRRRIDILAFFTFIEALIQATQMGIDVSSTLRAQAEQMRVSYFQAVEKSANAIPMLILFPSVFGIFPPLILVTVGPVMLELKRKLAGM